MTRHRSELGNTMPAHRSRTFVFTSFEIDETVEKLKRTKPKFYRFGLEECPETGKKHHQGMVHYENARRFESIRKKLAPMHLEVQRGSNEKNFEYTGKDGDITEWGTPSEQGARNDLLGILEMVKEREDPQDILEAYPAGYVRYYKHFGLPNVGTLLNHQEGFRKVKVHVITGAPGTGKTRQVYDTHRSFDICKITQYNPEWWQSHNSTPKVLLLDEYEPGAINEDRLRQITDGHPCDLPIKGGFISCARVEEVYIISNSELHWSEAMQRRIS